MQSIPISNGHPLYLAIGLAQINPLAIGTTKQFSRIQIDIDALAGSQWQLIRPATESIKLNHRMTARQPELIASRQWRIQSRTNADPIRIEGSIQTPGNPDTHLVLRGGHSGPNYSQTHVANARAGLEKNGIPARLMVDCSHANSGKDPLRQPDVFNDVLEQHLSGDRSLIGMMLESHLFEGCQPLSDNLRYGVSVTDGCLGWDATEALLRTAARQLQLQRARNQVTG